MVALPVLREHLPSAKIERTNPQMARISLTDRCDLACVYCRPSRADGYLAMHERLDVSAWERMVRGLVHAGVTRIRITGGEPLLFAGLLPIVRCISALGVADLALTTNGTRLAALARPLREAGLRRLNISLASLDPARFERLTRGGSLASVLEGIAAAGQCGFDEIKTNTVVLRGENEEELPSIATWAWERGMTPRFLEVMGVGEGSKLVHTQLVPYAEQRLRLAALLAQENPEREAHRGPARYVRSRDGRNRIGFITGASDTFCAGCDRLRVSTDGTLRPCLALADGVAAGDVVAQPSENSDALIAARLAEAWERKPDGHWRGCNEVTASLVSMRASGG